MNPARMNALPVEMRGIVKRYTMALEILLAVEK
jgi:hypothetical protein